MPKITTVRPTTSTNCYPEFHRRIHRKPTPTTASPPGRQHGPGIRLHQLQPFTMVIERTLGSLESNSGSAVAGTSPDHELPREGGRRCCGSHDEFWFDDDCFRKRRL